MSAEDQFRKELRRAPRKPGSPYTGYAVAGALAFCGSVCVVVAKSDAIYQSGLLLLGASLVAALVTLRANRRWFR